MADTPDDSNEQQKDGPTLADGVRLIVLGSHFRKMRQLALEAFHAFHVHYDLRDTIIYEYVQPYRPRVQRPMPAHFCHICLDAFVM